MGAALCPSGPGGGFPPPSCPTAAPGEARRSGNRARSFLPSLEDTLGSASGRGTAPPAFLTPRRRRSVPSLPGRAEALRVRGVAETILAPPPPFHFGSFSPRRVQEGSFLFLPLNPGSCQRSSLPSSPPQRKVPGLGCPWQKWRSPVGVQTLPKPQSLGGFLSLSKWEALTVGQ